jgi:hypothetical protein
MRLVRMVAVLALLGLAASARADEVVVERHRSSPVGTVLRDTVGGGLLGSAVAGGIILYQMGINDKSDYDWGRTLAWGAGIGLGVGLVLGLVDAASGSYGMTRTPYRDGMSMSLNHRDQSNTQVFPIVLRGF